MTAVFLEIALDVAEERDIAQRRGNQEQQGDDEDDGGKCNRDEEEFGDESSLVPKGDDEVGVEFLKREKGVEGEGVHSLTRAVRENQSFPALKSEEDEKGKVILLLGGVLNLREKAEVIIRPDAVVCIRHDICECVRYIAAGNDLLCLPALVYHEEIAKDDAPDEDPMSGSKVDTALKPILIATGVYLVGPGFGRQHGYGREKIRKIHNEGFGEEGVDKHI